MSDPGPSWPSCLLYDIHQFFVYYFFFHFLLGPIYKICTVTIIPGVYISCTPCFVRTVYMNSNRGLYMSFERDRLLRQTTEFKTCPTVWRVPRGSVVKCLTLNPGVLGSSRTGSSGFFSWECPWARHFIAQPSTGESRKA